MGGTRSWLAFGLAACCLTNKTGISPCSGEVLLPHTEHGAHHSTCEAHLEALSDHVPFPQYFSGLRGSPVPDARRQGGWYIVRLVPIQYHGAGNIDRGRGNMARDHRRLAAIVSLDVVGYSRRMGVDDSGTLAALKTQPPRHGNGA